MVKKKILIADKINSKGVELLKKYFIVKVVDYKTNDELFKTICIFKPNAIIIRSFRKIDKYFIDRLLYTYKPDLLFTASTGYDNIDINYAISKNIRVFSVPNGNYISAAEHTMALIFSIYKNLFELATEVKSSNFFSFEYKNYELYAKTIGIIGVGRVGSYVARIARSLNLNILGNDIKNLQSKYRWIRFTNLNELLKLSDIITIHTPLDSSTYNLISKNEIKLMKKEAILINCARGGIINETYLINALKNNYINYAGLDVFENEPDIREDFYRLKNIIITPHVAGKTKESHERISLMLAYKIIEYYKFSGNNIKLK